MTDLVKRLRQYEIGNLALQETWVGEMREAADEIERVCAGRDTMGNLWAKEKEARRKADAEIERLLEEVTMIARAKFCDQETIAEQNDEIEQLRTEVERLREILGLKT